MNPVFTTLRRTAASAAVHAMRAALLLATFAVAAPASAADTVSESRPIGAFRSVRLVGSADLVLKQSDTPSLTVEGDKDTMGAFKVETRGDELVLSYESKTYTWFNSDRKGPRFILTTRTLDRLSTSGTGDVTAGSFTLPGDFEIAVAGSSDIRFASLAARKLLVRISGSGDVTLAGGVLEQNVRIAGSGDYRSGALQSAIATITIAGAGDATLWARDNLSVKIAGTGDVKYYGRPTITKSIAGVGSVTSLGDKP
jgi:hypothetical protein